MHTCMYLHVDSLTCFALLGIVRGSIRNDLARIPYRYKRVGRVRTTKGLLRSYTLAAMAGRLTGPKISPCMLVLYYYT